MSVDQSQYKCDALPLRQEGLLPLNPGRNSGIPQNDDLQPYTVYVIICRKSELRIWQKLKLGVMT
jgi:hypothetical protein